MKTRAARKTSAVAAKTRITAIRAVKNTSVPAKTRITATEAARNFSEILNRVAYKGESFIVERSGRPICEIAPAEKQGISTKELVEFLRSVSYPDKGYFRTLQRITRNQPKVAPSPWDR
jgi:prevent-host-death family protein